MAHTMSKDDAHQALVTHLHAIYADVLTDTRSTLTIFTDQTVDVGDGWVFVYRIHRADDAIGPYRALVDIDDGSIHSIAGIPSLAIQMAVHRALYKPAARLPWPHVRWISLAGWQHAVVNLAPASTLCDEPLPQTSPLRWSSADPTCEDELCWACMAAIRPIGPFCFRCETHLRPHEHTLCSHCIE